MPGIALPFYLAQPRLMRLEKRFMQQVESGNSRWLMRILRHETGHALDTAYRLRERKDWREVRVLPGNSQPGVERKGLMSSPPRRV